MKNFKRMTGFILMCMMIVTLAGAAWASSGGSAGNANGDTNTAGEGTAAESGTNANNAGTEGGEIASFNNYGDNGNYEALGEYEVAYGADLDEVTSKLPATLTAKLTSGEEVEVPVTWVCVNDGVGGTAYVPEHTDATVVYTFEAQLGEGYTMADNIADDYMMPFATVSYTEDAQTLNSNADGENGDAADGAVGDTDGGFGWSWIIWIIVIVLVVVILWWIFAGNKGGKDNSSNVS